MPTALARLYEVKYQRVLLTSYNDIIIIKLSNRGLVIAVYILIILN